MTNISTTNLPSGMTNAQLGSVLSTYGAFDPSVVHSYWNDFDTFIVGSAGAADWKNTATGSVTNALVAGAGGILSLGNSAANNDLDSLQLMAAGFAVTAGNQAWFKCRFNISNATNAALTIGLIQTTTTPLTVTDGIYFSKAAASTTLVGKVAKSSTASSVNLATLANTTYVNVGWWYNGVDTVQFFINGLSAGSVGVTNLPTANLNATLAVANGTAAANTLLVDYIFAAVERSQAASA